jgi:hypothetical protein
MKETTLFAKVSSSLSGGPPPGATMIGSVRAGLGLGPVPPTDGTDNGRGGVDNSDDTESLASSASRSVMEEVSEYCPTMTYQQVSKRVLCEEEEENLL